MAGLSSVILFGLWASRVAVGIQNEQNHGIVMNEHGNLYTEPSLVLGPHNSRQSRIVDMMKHAWKGYEKHCFGSDELRPLDGTCVNTWRLGVTLIDGLDTLYLMGLKDEFRKARDWVANHTTLNFDKVNGVSLFETTIRVMGGLLGAHAVSGDSIFLDRAKELGDRLLPAFREPPQSGHGNQRPPRTDVNVRLRQGEDKRDPYLAESTSLGLEFNTLAQLTGSHKYRDAVQSVSSGIHKQPKWDGVALHEINPTDGTLHGKYKLGAGGDSYYEYLLKQWLLTGRKESTLLQDYEEAMTGIRKHLVKNTKGPMNLTYIAELFPDKTRVDKTMDHLVCFLPGTLALGVYYGTNTSWHLQLAQELVRTCYNMYNVSGHMLAPEIANFDREGKELYIDKSASHDLLRPETLESLFYLYRLTGDKKYQVWGWQIAEGIERWAKVEGGGYASLESVLEKQPKKRNHMESFFLAETLKYLFLLFDDSRTQVPLDKFVFNTEAHPFRIWQTSNLKPYDVHSTHAKTEDSHVLAQEVHLTRREAMIRKHIYQ